MDKHYQSVTQQVKAACQQQRALNICGANTKTFYGGQPSGTPLDTSSNQGIIEHDPAELVIIARAGTRLDEIQQTLAQSGQMLGFEPPFAQSGATIGGAIATGLAGSCRPYRGGARDYLLGTKIVNGKGEYLQFGGRVMKNVAGFDLFRPMAGSMGTLGVLLEVSLRVIPIPEQQISVCFTSRHQAEAIEAMSGYAKSLASISAAAWIEGEIKLRLSGSKQAIARDRALLSQQSDCTETDSEIWSQLASFEHAFFKNTEKASNTMLINVPAATRPLALNGDQIIDWGGARRYLKTTTRIEDVRKKIIPLGGSVSCLSCADRALFFQPLSPALKALHQRLKQSFDPACILNPGRLYPDL